MQRRAILIGMVLFLGVMIFTSFLIGFSLFSGEQDTTQEPDGDGNPDIWSVVMVAIGFIVLVVPFLITILRRYHG